MANEVLHSSLEADVRMADLIGGAVRITLADTASIRNTGAIDFLGGQNGMGSDTFRSPRVTLNAFTATAAENTATANTALADASETIAVVRHSLVREISDLARATSRGAGDIDIPYLAQMMVLENEQGWMDSLAAVVAGFSATAGATGVNLSVDNVYEAIAALEIASVPGPYYGMLHPRQLADLQTSVRAETGVAEWKTDHGELLAMKDQGFFGSFLGINFFSSSRVDTANTAADRAGAIWGAGAIGYKTATAPPVAGAVMSQPNDILTVELQRPDRAATTLVVGHSYYGISLLEDARGVAVITDA